MNALSRKKAYRTSMLRNLATSLILYEKIVTTTAKAKATKAIAEHLISIAKKNDLSGRRRLLAYLFDKNAAKKMFEELAPRYKTVSSGFIRSYKLAPRLGDGAAMTMLQLKPVKAAKKEEIEDENGKDQTGKTARATSAKTKSKTAK